MLKKNNSDIETVCGQVAKKCLFIWGLSSTVVVNLCTGSFGTETAALPFVCFESLSSEIEFILILTLSFKQ